MIRRTPDSRRRAVRSRWLPALAALAAVAVTQLGPVPLAVTVLSGHGALHACGCTGAVCVCPHPGKPAGHPPANRGPSCLADSGEGLHELVVFDTCSDPRGDAAPPVPGVLAVPAPAPGPAFAGRLAPDFPHRPLAPAGGLDPPPPRAPSVA